jgi:O-antigen/teichoic acid export membrane protein
VTDTDVQPAADEPTLGNQVSRALGWSTLAQVLGRVGSFAVGIVLARLLTKEEFGAYAVTLAAISLLIVVNDLGVIAAVIRWQGEVREAARTATTLSIVFSAIAFLIAFVGAGPFSRALGSPDAANLVRVVALVLLIDGATAAHQAMLVRTFRNDRLVLAELTGFLVGTPVTVALAFAGAGPWSIVIGRVVGAVAIGAQVVRYAPFSIRPAFDRALASQLVRFGAPLALSALIAQAVLNVDYLIVGRELGSVALGVYLLAFNLSSWPASLVSTAIARVAFAGFSRLVEDRTRLVVAFPRSIGVAVSVLVPLVVVLAVLGPEVITVVYGERWLEAATPLRFLVVLGGMRVLIDLFVDLSIADGRPNVALAIRSIWLAALVPAIAVGAAASDLRGVGIAHLVVGGLIVLPLAVADSRRSGIAMGDLAANVARPVLAGCVAVLAMLAVLPVLHGDIVRLVAAGAVGGVAYLAVLLPRNPLLGWALSQVRRREPASV